MSMTFSESRASRDGAARASEDAAPLPTSAAPGPRSVRSGKLPRNQLSAERERADHDYARRLTAARKALAKAIERGGVASLQALRLHRGLSQTQLAELLGTSQSHIAKIEAGQVRLYLDTAIRLADALNIGLDDLRRILPPATYRSGE